ncbi:MAG: MFS transporter [Cytophagales bacterium]|nr:MFS transporter [Cytophagales bacterium]
MKNERLLLFVMASVQFTHMLYLMVLVPMSDLIIDEFQISTQEFSWLAAAYPLSSFVSSILGVFILDKYERKSSLLIAYGLFIVGCYLSAYLPTFDNHEHNFYALLFSRSFTGLFGGVISALVLSIVSDLTPKERRGSAMGIVMSSFALAVAVGVPLGRFLAGALDWQTPFLLVTTLSCFFFLTVLAFIPPVNAHLQYNQRQHSIQMIKNAFQKRPQRNALLFMMFIVIGKFSIVPFIATYMRYNMDFSARAVPLIYFLGGIVSVIFTPLIGRLSDRVGRRNTFYFLAVISIFPLFAITHSTPQSVFAALLVTSSFFTFMNGRMVPVNAMISSVPEPQNRGGFMSMSAAAQSLATGIASIVAGYIVQIDTDQKLIDFDYVGYIAIVCTIISIFIVKKVESRVM